METILRTVRRAPEVMVKVLTRGATTSKAAVAHLAYLDRKGELEIETDDGEKLVGAKAAEAIVDGWDLDLEDGKAMESEGRTANHRKPRLVHKLIFSMPPGTPPEEVLGAVRVFAREEFALRNRYAMVLHTDEPHPHVHVVVKAIGEDGERLNIKKPTLRHWRHEFARRMREQGIDANATERGARGIAGRRPPDGRYRAGRRGELRLSDPNSSQTRSQDITGTLLAVRRGWQAVARAIANASERGDRLGITEFASSVDVHERDLSR
jgi:hypothetical protein